MTYRQVPHVIRPFISALPWQLPIEQQKVARAPIHHSRPVARFLSSPPPIQPANLINVNSKPTSPSLCLPLLRHVQFPPSRHKSKMFRTAILRSVFRPAAVAVRTAAPRTSLVAAPRYTVVAPRAAAWAGAVRSYAASAGLSKQEVEDRIKALLQGFDKVSCFSRLRL